MAGWGVAGGRLVGGRTACAEPVEDAVSATVGITATAAVVGMAALVIS